MIDTSPVIDVIAAKVLLNLSFVFKNKIVGFKITATIRETANIEVGPNEL